MNKDRIYLGHIISRCAPNSSGMRWHSLTKFGVYRAETLADIKQVIRGLSINNKPKG